MDELEFYNGAYTGAQVDEGIGKALALGMRGYYNASSVTVSGNNTSKTVASTSAGAGKYIACVDFEWDSTATGTVGVINIVNSSNQNIALNGNKHVSFCVPFELNENSTINLIVYHATSTSKDITRVSFAVIKII